VTVNLDTVAVVSRSLGSEQPPSYFFRYRIASDDLLAITDCGVLEFGIAESDRSPQLGETI
jgi:hypothetical protein